MFAFPLLGSALACTLGGALLFAAPPAPSSIFDGRALTGWEGNAAVWRVEDGAITGEIPAGGRQPKNQFIFWQGEVHDFDLTLEFRLTGGPRANSGVQFRSQRLPDGDAAGYQADLDNGAAWLGSIYDEHGRTFLSPRGKRVAVAADGRRTVEEFATPASFRDLFRAGEWNTYRITAAGPHIEVRVNDRLCTVLDDHETGVTRFSGQLGFQLHSGPGPVKIQFRHIRLVALARTAPHSSPGAR